MWQIKYQDRFLDIRQGQTAEIERKSPLFILEELLSEASTPIEFENTENNVAAIGKVFFEKSVKSETRLNVELYEKNTFFSNAVLVIEGAGNNSRHNRTANCSGYLLTGISNFFSEIQDKKMTDLVLGGERSFDYTTDDPTDASGGYWQHVQESYDYSKDYVFAMFRNDSITDDDIEHTYTYYFVNSYKDGAIETTQPICPWPKLSYVLNQVFKENGWTLDTSLIDGTGWEKIVLYSYNLISTGYYLWDPDGSVVNVTPRPNIVINLKDCMPQNTNISSWVFALCKNYFWAPICDIATRTCKIYPLRNIHTAEIEDWTEIANPVSATAFPGPPKVWAFKNNFVGEDEYPTSLDISAYTTHGTVANVRALPDASDGSKDNLLYFVFAENRYYIVSYDADSNTRSWVPLGNNIYSEEPVNATDTIETDASSLPTIRQQLPGGLYGYVSIVSQKRNTTWGIRTTLWHGLVVQMNDDDSPVGIDYPCAISSNTPPALSPQLPWSDVWRHNDFTKDWGKIEYWGRKWIDANEPQETIKRFINLPVHKQTKFRWETIKLIHNIPYLVKSYIKSTEDTKGILCTLSKVKLVNYAVVEEPPFDGTARFNGYITTVAAPYHYVATQYVKGTPGATITIEVILITESFGDDFYEKVNGSDVIEGYDFTVTLDSNGDGHFIVDLGGVSRPGAAVLIRFQIVPPTTDIGSPDIAQHSKITG